jgi:hypothetical protein
VPLVVHGVEKVPAGLLGGGLSTRNEIQLGRKEYWTATTAVSPPYMYSSGSTRAGLSQPVPVVVATTRTFRLKVPVRSSSLTASVDSSPSEGADFSPT